MTDQPGETQLPPRDQLIRSLARLVAGLAVPVSLPTPLGAARDAWGAVHGQLVGFGWTNSGQYEKAIRNILDGPGALTRGGAHEFKIPDDEPDQDDETRQLLMDALDLASDQGQRSWIIQRSTDKRLAMVVPVDDGESLEDVLYGG